MPHWRHSWFLILFAGLVGVLRGRWHSDEQIGSRAFLFPLSGFQRFSHIFPLFWYRLRDLLQVSAGDAATLAKFYGVVMLRNFNDVGVLLSRASQREAIGEQDITSMKDSLRGVAKLKNFKPSDMERQLNAVLSSIIVSPFALLFVDGAPCTDVGVLEDMAVVGEKMAPLFSEAHSLRKYVHESDCNLEPFEKLKVAISSTLQQHEANTVAPKTSEIAAVFETPGNKTYWQAPRRPMRSGCGAERWPRLSWQW